MKRYAYRIYILILSLLSVHVSFSQVQCWLTTHDGTAEFMEQKDIPFSKENNDGQIIRLDKSKTYQTMDGFGYTLTGGSATLLHKMSPERRHKILTNLFSASGNNIGISYLRLSIGASDMNAFVYSYDDMPKGETDVPLTHFSLAHDDTDVIPVLKEILQIAPAIKILGSPWSAPVWMKDNGDTRGGSLQERIRRCLCAVFCKIH